MACRGAVLVVGGEARRSVAVGIPPASAPLIRFLVSSGVFRASATHVALPFFPGIAKRKKKGHLNEPAFNSTLH